MDITSILNVLLSVGVAAAIAYFVGTKDKKKRESTPQEPQVDVSKNEVVLEAKTTAKEILLEAKDAALRVKNEAEETARKLVRAAEEKEKNLAIEKAKIEEREKDIETKARSLKQIKDALEEKQLKIDELYKAQKTKLEDISSLTKEEARKLLMEQFDKDLASEKGRRIKEMEEKIAKDVEDKSRDILIDAMSHGVTDYVVEYTTSRVKLPDDEMKGRIIGKSGRNITSFEKLTGVELDLDSSPGEIIISSFDPVRREVARASLERLVADGRIQPSRIEDIVAETQKEIEHLIFKEGDNLCHILGVYNLPKDVIYTLGRFKYRFSYGQNMIKHTLEVTKIGMALAHELGVDVETVKLGCLLHDIGKVLNDEEGSHIQVGVDFLKKHKLSDQIVNCVLEHHEDRPFSSIETAIVALADHISGARPSARSEDYESYVKRMKDLEDAALSFDGVENVYAISAGREIRVFVKPEVVDDASTALLAREIARKIELEQTYPGVVKVTVIRETRVTETAK